MTIDLGSRHLHATRAEGLLRVVIDRPERRNALTIEMYHGLKKAAVLAARDPAVHVLLVTAAGDWFCVGGEMGGKHEGDTGLDRETDGIDLLPFVQFERCPKIVVMGINGACQGGGLNMTLTSDLAIVKVKLFVPYDLISFMTLSRDDHHVVGPCNSDRFVYRIAAV